MGQSGQTPSNVNTIEFDLNNGGWIIIIVLLCIILILIGIALYVYFKKQKEIDKLQELQNRPLTDKEINLLNDFRKLNEESQKAIMQTAKTMKNNLPESPKE